MFRDCKIQWIPNSNSPNGGVINEVLNLKNPILLYILFHFIASSSKAVTFIWWIKIIFVTHCFYTSAIIPTLFFLCSTFENRIK